MNREKLVCFVAVLLWCLVILTACAPPKDGLPGEVGTPGIDGTPGSDGSDGKDGSDGDNGQDGRDGEDGSIITMVKFCAGDHDNYPNSFPEYGFCIDGKLYATFSDKGGFTALLTPGNYQSNAINSKCNFIVMPGCQVQEIE